MNGRIFYEMALELCSALFEILSFISSMSLIILSRSTKYLFADHCSNIEMKS